MKATKLLAAVLMLAAMLGAEKPSCGRERVDTDRPPQERQVDPKRERVVTIVVTGSGPFEVLVIAQAEDRQEGVERYGPEIFASTYQQTLVYTAGRKIRIRVHAEANPRDEIECMIADGGEIDRQQNRGEVLCTLLTSR